MKPRKLKLEYQRLK